MTTLRCTNAEPGSFNHECGRPATWRGRNARGFSTTFCDGCKDDGWEARRFGDWQRLEQQHAA